MSDILKQMSVFRLGSMQFILRGLNVKILLRNKV